MRSRVYFEQPSFLSEPVQAQAVEPSPATQAPEVRNAQATEPGDGGQDSNQLALKWLRRLAPHVAFLLVAGGLFLMVWGIERQPSRGGWIHLDGMFYGLYYWTLGVYAASYLFSVWLVRYKTGRWRFGAAYLVAIALSPVFFCLGSWIFISVC